MSTEKYKEFGRRVRGKRKALRHTQGECAVRVPCSVRTWQRVEEGVLPAEDNARVKLESNVARVLGCSVAELRGEKTHTESDPDTLSIEQYRQLLLQAPSSAEKQAQLDRVRAHLRNQVTLFFELLMVERGLLPPQERVPSPLKETGAPPPKGAS